MEKITGQQLTETWKHVCEDKESRTRKKVVNKFTLLLINKDFSGFLLCAHNKMRLLIQLHALVYNCEYNGVV